MIVVPVMLIANIADYASTQRLLKRGGEEAVPGSRWVIENWGLRTWLILKVAISWAYVFACIYAGQMAYAWAAAAVFFAFAIRNETLNRE